MAKFFRFPFALNGDRAVIPDEAQSDGSISFNQGFGPDYERNPTSDPLAKRVPRDETNQYLYDITDNIRQYQLNGTPDWTTAAQNGGAPVAYSYGARVRYDAGSGARVWQSASLNNTSTPGADANWVLSEPFNFAANVATNAEVQAGTLNTKIVTPLNLRALTATTARPGIAVLASSAEVIAGTDTAKIVTPAGLSARTATETVTGLAALATVAEVQAGTNSAKIVTPATLVQRIATAAARGLAALATQAEVIAGTVTDKIVTPATLNGRTATTTRTGLVELATDAETQAGTSADLAVTPASLRSSMLGVGQTWQTFTTPTRQAGQTYQNTTGRPIMVTINAAAPDSGTGVFLQASVDAANWVTIGSCSVGGNTTSMGGVIPNDQYYRVTRAFNNWAELR